MGIVRGIQKGEANPSDFNKDAQDAAKKMKKSSVKKYAKTKHKGLPLKKESMTTAQSKAAHKKFKETGELPPHLKKLFKDLDKVKTKHKVTNVVVPGLEWMSKLGEAADRDYKAEYKKFQSSTKSKKYRAELNQYNRKKGTYGNGDGKDASHKRGKIVGFESQSKNRGRAEKSRLKKESINEGNPLEIGKLRDAILMFKKKIEKQGMVKNARDEDHLERLIKVYNKMGGKKIKEGTTKMFPSAKVDAAVKLAKRMGGNMTSAVKKIEKMAKGLSKNGRVEYALRKANEGLGDKMAKKIKKHKGTKVKKEGVNEVKEPPVIVDLRDIVKKKQNKVMKDPVSGKKMRVDGYTANAIVKVYDAINTSNKKKFTSQPLMKMAKIAFKFVK